MFPLMCLGPGYGCRDGPGWLRDLSGPTLHTYALLLSAPLVAELKKNPGLGFSFGRSNLLTSFASPRHPWVFHQLCQHGCGNLCI
ncbi:hypothetical protein CHELA1G11_11993 [Hyphomicrobiales bacterium]|nr:hypothetical protein CHELA1G11_11993 [Hyphomicrobiales bacterium]CAH1664038.1 hypothetical protein CHELA1G2_12319 [Hyphomicrobiales bacterium]